MTVREATAADIPRIVEMAIAFGHTAPMAQAFPVSAARVEALTLSWLTSPMTATFVAVNDEDAAIGMVSVGVFEHPFLAMRMGSVLTWWVEPAYRGRAGLALLARVQTAAAARGADVLQVAAPLSAQLGELCQALGFLPSEESWTRRI